MKGKESQLLEWEPTQGWAPLCEFLGEPIPDKSFRKPASVRDQPPFLYFMNALLHKSTEIVFL